jgi:molybdate transport system substrate-binding protein
VLGLLPPAIQIVTTFSGGVARTSARTDSAHVLLAFMASPDVAAIKQKNGMEAA